MPAGRVRRTQQVRKGDGATTRRAPERDGPTNMLLQLQQQVGNRATNNVVGQVQRRVSPTDRKIRRFPATVLAQPAVPINWVEETAKVKKSGEGASGGVFFLTSKSETEPRMVVVKPNYGVNANASVEEAGQMVFGDRAISGLFGVGAPTSRIVRRGAPEFEQLVQLCKTEDVEPTDPEDKQFWHPVTDAKAMIVMGAVPNATSLTSLANEAWDSPEASQRLSDAVFSKSFLHDMGKLFIADLMIGNDDRIHATAMNVGNMMVSSMKGEHKLVAIDSRAVLGGEFNPEEVLQSGSVSKSGLTGGFGSTKKSLAKAPEEYVDAFFTTLKSWMRRGPKGDVRSAPENTLDPAEVLWDTYQGRKPQCVQAFTNGWQEALETVRQLVSSKEGRARMKGVVGSVQDEPGKEQVQYTTLKINAMYLAGRAGNKTHEEASPSAARYAAIKWLKQFDPDSIRIPRDEFFWDVAKPPKGDVLTGDVSELGKFLPPAADMNVMGQSTLHLNPALMAQLGTKIAAIKSDLETVAPKTKGLVSKREVTRNRVVVAKWLADCYLLGAGTRRAIDRVRQMDDTARFLELAVGGAMSTADAKLLMTPAMMIRQYHKTLTRHLESYSESLNEVLRALSKVKRYGDRATMATTLDKLRKDADRALEMHAHSSRLQNPQIYEHALSGSLGG
jgi:hypothetical protein